MDEEEIENLRHCQAKELEELRWGFRKQELTFLEAGEHLRALNQHLWRVPSMVIAITGGIWFVAASLESDFTKTLVLSFAGLVDFLTILIIFRLRSLISMQIKIQNRFSGLSKSKKSHVVVWCWTLLLVAAGILSAVGATRPSDVDNEKSAKEPQVNNYHYPEKVEIVYP